MLENGKHVLCEKPLTLNAKDTKKLIEVARTNKRFLMEAVWSRFVPSYQFLAEQLQKGTIGDLLHVSATFGAAVANIERVLKPELGGGTILDLGIYTINLAQFVFRGEKPSKIAAVGHLSDQGVDLMMTASLLYKDGKTASVTSCAHRLHNSAYICGTKGTIRVSICIPAQEPILFTFPFTVFFPSLKILFTPLKPLW